MTKEEMDAVGILAVCNSVACSVKKTGDPLSEDELWNRLCWLTDRLEGWKPTLIVQTLAYDEAVKAVAQQALILGCGESVQLHKKKIKGMH